MSKTSMSWENTKEASIDELCDMALKHYEEISNKAMHSNSLIPAAIECYRNQNQAISEAKLEGVRELAEKIKKGSIEAERCSYYDSKEPIFPATLNNNWPIVQEPALIIIRRLFNQALEEMKDG